MSNGKYLIVVGGATASGKTALAVRLAQYFQTEIISADSRQFFREMQIGTAKPDETELGAAKHHFIGHLELDTAYSVGDFVRDALVKLEDLFSRKDIVVLVGGSGLYIRGLCEGLDEFPEVSQEVREELVQLYEKTGIRALQEELLVRDPDYYQEVDLANPHRLIRALSVCRSSGQPFSSFRKKLDVPRNFTPIYLQLYWPREQLYARINERVDRMMAAGLLAEARELFPQRHLNALKTVGYQELFDYLDGQCSLEDAVELIKQNSRRYAKRQLTWMRKKGQGKMLRPTDWSIVLQYVALCRKAGFKIEESAVADATNLDFYAGETTVLKGSWLKLGKKEFFLPQNSTSLQEPFRSLILHELSLRCMDRGAHLLAPVDWVPDLLDLGLAPNETIPLFSLLSNYIHLNQQEEWILLTAKV